MGSRLKIGKIKAGEALGSVWATGKADTHTEDN
jgi:hypothetical protein